MRGPWRAALALALHVGFFALPVVLVCGLAATAALTFRYEDASTGLHTAIAAAVVTFVFVVGLRTVLRVRQRPRGVPLDESKQQKFWQLVEGISNVAGAPVPDEIRVTCEPRVNVCEDTALLGLRSRAFYLEIGLPLLAGLNASELQAALASELGQAGSGGRLRRTVQRASIAVAHTAHELTGGPTKWLFNGYARCFAAVAGSVDTEFSGDAVAVRLTGKRVAIATLRKITALEFGWRCYSDEYLAMATSAGRTPDLVPGFRAFLDHPHRKKQLAEHAKRTIAEQTSDDHPTTRQRIDAMKRLSGKEREVDEQPAIALLRNPRRTVPALEDQLLINGLGPRVPWPEMAKLAGAAQVAQQAAMLSSAIVQSGVTDDASIAGVLAAIHRGQGADLVNPVLNPGLDPERIPEAAVDTLTELLGATVVDALVGAGRARHELDWGGPSLVRLGNGQPLDPDRLVRPAVADPRLVPGLHRTLVNLGVPLQHSQSPADDPEPVTRGVVSAVRYSGRLHELLVTDRGLLLVPNRSSATKRLLAAVSAPLRRSENEKLAELTTTPVDQLRERPGAQWVDSRDVASARWLHQSRGWLLALELYLDDYSVSALDTAGIEKNADSTARLELRCTADSEEREDPYDGLGELMGARMRVDDQRD